MDDSQPPPPGPRPALPAGRASLWARMVRRPRGAAGIGIVAAALLLWPFSEWSAIPWLVGLVVLVLLALLRLDRLLGGWSWHLAGLAVVAGLMWSTSPWAWALAGSIGVLLAGVLQLPAWRLAAVGAVLCVVSGVAFGWAGYRSAEQAEADNRAESERNYALTGERTPERVLPALLEGIEQGDVTGVCGLLDEPARGAVVLAAGSPDCAAAVGTLRAAVGASIGDYDELGAGTVETGAGEWTTDGCGTVWADPRLGGAQLGRIVIRQAEPAGRPFYFLAGFEPCPAVGDRPAPA